MNDTTFGKMLVLTEVIAEQTLVNSNSFKKMMVVLKDHSVQVGNCIGNSTDNGTRLRGKHYYWTHDPSIIRIIIVQNSKIELTVMSLQQHGTIS